MKINLNRFNIGEKQTSGIMAVYPILGDDAVTKIASFSDINFEGTVNYGEMVFSNKSDLDFIIPSGYAIITKQEAQDHGLPNAEFLKAKSSKISFRRACCIQETQCGYISPVKATDFRYIPLNIRKSYLKDDIYKNIDNYSFSRLWDYIHSFQEDLVKRDESNLILFFDKYLNKLANFNAEFECVENQIGAIILLNDEIIGIEIAPSKEYWKILWKLLIRDCYGSEVIRRVENKLIDIFKDSLKLKVDYSGCLNIDDIINTFNDSLTNEKKKGKDILDSLSEIDFSNNSNKAYSSLNYCKIFDDNDKVGEVFIGENSEVVYLSLLF